MTTLFDITTAPESELLDDLHASIDDIRLCEMAIALHIDYPNTQKRLRGNQMIIDKINAEFARRKNSQPKEAKNSG
jgi:hypothetical protein